ncbi:GNAT family N-acetyltransferase [Alisedimentitalea sp. MJ-SS2]|uniref:GNAT family N-acetyltransferase n=1 Tax=Aliisedimentitalea sp. MJ-SS2 TaxID=3049795 RepID=UPI00290B8E22|nr:GNAT family N-acetyltransferase [Alisedimentitalea sp. MJ-SS2]MDU8927633.1 GNAT family N-acetyltransferase [Alisedimentitalea sp. MJ-SS2]
MTLPDAHTLYDVIDGTWPAAEYVSYSPFTLRKGAGGGQRVAAATTDQPVTADDIATAEEEMKTLNVGDQPPIFMVREGQSDLDTQLAARGYPIVDPVNLYACNINLLTTEPIPPVTAIPVWEPLAIMRDMWAEGGIGEGRINVMHRATGPKTAIVARWNDHPGGCAFVAIHNGIAMVHALEILNHQRQQGLGKWMMRRAAFWAHKHGADTMSVVCTQANTGANALYSSLGMTLVGQYHYRKLKDA